jgi:hypothetical protein
MTHVAEMYLLGGITLVSELPLPELPIIQLEQATPYPVNIRLGDVSTPLPGAIEVDPDCFATPSYFFLRIRGIGSYLVSNGTEIVINPEAGALALDVRAYLLGTLFTILCQQRGLLPLHASAVSSGKGVVAFLARSGQGKSSLAAHLAQRGFQVVADDVCLIDITQTGQATVTPAAPWLKLWHTSLQSLGWQVEGLERVFSEDDKYRLPLKPSPDSEPIRKLVFLASDDGSKNEMRSLSAVEAIPLLMNLTHQAYVLEATGQRQQNFLRCSRVSAQAKAYRLIRPWGLSHLKITVDELEKFLLED